MTPCKWLYRGNDDDSSLTLEFTTLSPCPMVRVTGEGDVRSEQSSIWGDYRLVFIRLLDTMQIQTSLSKALQTHRKNYIPCQVRGWKVERGTASLQKSWRKVAGSARAGGMVQCLDYQKIHNRWWSLHTKWKGNKLPFITWGWTKCERGSDQVEVHSRWRSLGGRWHQCHMWREKRRSGREGRGGQLLGGGWRGSRSGRIGARTQGL